jgi:glycosyltransferase involved in cell wall biosynthesis
MIPMSHTPPRFSVVIPLYNKEGYIERTVQSVLDQIFSDFELLIVDDGSTDRSAQRVMDFDDPRIRLITQKNGGEPVARNRGIAEARADFVGFLDADDLWHPEFLAAADSDMRAHPDITFWTPAYEILKDTGAELARYSIAPDGPAFIPNYFDACLKDPIVMPSTSILARRVLQEKGGFPVGIPLGGDILFWAQVVQTERLFFHPIQLATYRREMGNNYSVTQKAPPKRLDVLDFLEDRIRDGDLSSLRYVQFYSRKSAYRQAASGRPSLGLRILWQSLGLHLRNGRWSALPWFAVECAGLVRVMCYAGRGRLGLGG